MLRQRGRTPVAIDGPADILWIVSQYGLLTFCCFSPVPNGIFSCIVSFFPHIYFALSINFSLAGIAVGQ